MLTLMISDISNLELNNYDVSITDIDEETLRNEISRLFGIDYLAKATEDDARRDIDAINGYLYGEGRRAMVPCVVSNGNKAHWVHFCGYLRACNVPFREGAWSHLCREYT
jgi:hypothetical protein